MAVKHKVGDIWLQYVPTILRYWGSCDIGHQDQGRPSYRDIWMDHLEVMREDEQYEEVKESLIRKGWARPLTCIAQTDWWSSNHERDANRMIYGDGHHRLAAAIELGATYVPMRMVNSHWRLIQPDSANWGIDWGNKRVERSRSKIFKELDIPPFKVKD